MARKESAIDHIEELHIHLHIEGLVPLTQAVTAELRALGVLLTNEGDRMSQALDDLTAEVARTRAVEASAIVLIQGIAQRIADALASADPPAALQALQTDLAQGEADLSAAVAANQP